jgi:hypothetical protein
MQLSSIIKLPSFSGEPGPIHTLVQDENQNIYYSDEINHSLVSLNSAGEIRWQHSHRGKRPGEFQYPKGIEIGWIQNGNRTICIGVCDSWNSRIQFFDLDGHFLIAWDRAGEDCFVETVDIRFLDRDSDPSSGKSCWIVLDRGRHCLFGLDLFGSLLFKSGQECPEKLELNWQIPRHIAIPPAGISEDERGSFCYDPLFMPSRIFGSRQEGLFIWEPGSNRLKQVACGNMLPMQIEKPAGTEWIDADEERLLCFDRFSGMLGSYDPDAQDWKWTWVEGTPISACRSTKDIWIQNSSLIHHGTDLSEREECNALPWTLASLPDEIALIVANGLNSGDIQELQEALIRFREFSCKVLEIAADQWSESPVVEEMESKLASSEKAFGEALHRLKPYACSAFVCYLKIQALQSLHPSEENRRYIQQAMDRLEKTAIPLEKLAPALNVQKEFLLFRDHWLVACPARSFTENSKSADIRKDMLKKYSDVQKRVISELANWIWSNSFSENIKVTA